MNVVMKRVNSFIDFISENLSESGPHLLEIFNASEHPFDAETENKFLQR